MLQRTLRDHFSAWATRALAGKRGSVCDIYPFPHVENF
jgi:hypothetical protein